MQATKNSVVCLTSNALLSAWVLMSMLADSQEDRTGSHAYSRGPPAGTCVLGKHIQPARAGATAPLQATCRCSFCWCGLARAFHASVDRGGASVRAASLGMRYQWKARPARCRGRHIHTPVTANKRRLSSSEVVIGGKLSLLAWWRVAGPICIVC